MSFIGLLGILWKVYGMINCYRCRKYREPQIIFKPRLRDGFENRFLTWYIRVANKRLRGWQRNHCQRDEVVDCEVTVRFTIDGKLLAVENWWEDDKRTLLPNSRYEEFPLVSLEKANEDKNIVTLEGILGASTANPTPPLRIPLGVDVIADVSIKSESLKNTVTSKWCITIPSDLDSFELPNVERLEDEKP
ncbi:hypothetical protein ACFLXE_03985 [Chloroflexota bacterium]